MRKHNAKCLFCGKGFRATKQTKQGLRVWSQFCSKSCSSKQAWKDGRLKGRWHYRKQSMAQPPTNGHLTLEESVKMLHKLAQSEHIVEALKVAFRRSTDVKLGIPNA